ncbi:hypothetical protein GF386_04580 [Candidatus Pacearchaeota archaeon]|nr:hypothetical protein [Candidatus Pacearchaeota archaeon]MBD3283401.1 hypothetical protein [Candidatus Pacearchaeota archaeon]
MEKRGLAGIISMLLIIMIVLVSAVIIANIVLPMLRQAEKESGIDAFTTQLTVEESKIFVDGNAKISVKRNSGKANISEIKFLFEDEDGNTHSVGKKRIFQQHRKKELLK